MRTTTTPPAARTSTRVAIATMLSIAGAASAQADFAESFDDNGNDTVNGPQNLVADGWIFRNQSDPAENSGWLNGTEFGGVSFSGAGYLEASSLATDFFGGPVSCWAVLPDIPGLQAGDTLSVWIAGGGSAVTDTWFEVRHSIGGTDTGSSPTDVGDFTTMLYDAELPIATQGYQQVLVTVPEDGRLALRFRADYLSAFAGRGAIVSIDELTVGAAPPPPCGVPIPQPGETVFWTLADSPYTVCQDLLVPPGGTVVVDPGVTVNFDQNMGVRVEGTFTAIGTESQPITFRTAGGFEPSLDINGAADISFAEIEASVNIGGESASLVLTDSTVHPTGALGGVPDLVVVERCLFDGGSLGSFSHLAGSIRVTESTFVSGAGLNVAGLLHLDDIDIDGGQLRIGGEAWDSPTLLDNISVTGNTGGAGAVLYGANFLLGPDFETLDNLYPLEFEWTGAGLMWGSRLPTSGNINNHVPAEQFALGAHRELADTGIPYVFDGFPQNYGGSLIVEPGTELKFRPGAGAFLVSTSDLRLEGTPEEPITFDSFGGGRWFGLKWVDVFDAQARDTIFNGGELMLQSDGGELLLDHCVVTNAETGTASVTGGIVKLRGSEVTENFVGMTTTTSGRIEADGAVAPSIFEGNNIAVDYQNTSTTPYLRDNWWGDPSGPTNELFPEGQGDLVQNVHPASFVPFETSPPDLHDRPPTIRMEPTYFHAQQGDRIILRWNADDDVGLAQIRIEYAPHDFPREFETVAVLPGTANTWEFLVPEVAPNNLYPTPSAIRITAVDSIGQTWSDKSTLRIPYQEDWDSIEQDFTTTPTLVHPHDRVDVCWTPGGLGEVYVLLDGNRISRSAGGSNTGCLSIGATMPYASTDTARFVIVTTFGAGGRLTYNYSDYFSIRPDTRFGDAPPAIDLVFPLGGESFESQSVIPVEWTASDDEGLRSFRIQGSYDGGVTWHGVASDLPGESRSFLWNLPSSAGIDDVRVRVVATDHRFQNSSDTSDAFSIAEGFECPADVTGDTILDIFDVLGFLDLFQSGDPAADWNFDTIIDIFDVLDYLADFGDGC